jgi:LysR family hca operon transcriptional activator
MLVAVAGGHEFRLGAAVAQFGTKAPPASARRPETTTRPPSCAKANAVARPMPVSAPVISLWLPKLLDILRGELARTELTIHSASSPELMQVPLSGKMDVVFLRPDVDVHRLEFRLVAEKALLALLPADHRLAKRKSVRLDEIASVPFISFPKTYAPALRPVIDEYLGRSGVHVPSAHEAETLPVVISLVLSTAGLSLLPEYARRLLPLSVVGRPLRGRAPTIGLALGYSTTNVSTIQSPRKCSGETGRSR